MCAVQHACIYTEKEVVVTEGKQKDRTHVNTKTNMSALVQDTCPYSSPLEIPELIWDHGCSRVHDGVCVSSEFNQMKHRKRNTRM